MIECGNQNSQTQITYIGVKKKEKKEKQSVISIVEKASSAVQRIISIENVMLSRCRISEAEVVNKVYRSAVGTSKIVESLSEEVELERNA